MTDAVIKQVSKGEQFAISAIVWYEFLSGPVSDAELDHIRSAIAPEVLPFDRLNAEVAAALFNVCGRARKLKIDTLIAQCALDADCALMTANEKDFARFIPFGLRLLTP